MRVLKAAGVILGLVSMLLWAVPAPAQTLERGEIRGTIYDPSHSVVPKVNVTLSSASTGFKRTVQSDSDGIYAFEQIPPGEYTLTAEASNFAIVKVEDIELHVGASVTLDLSMQLMSQTKTVEVSATTAVETPTAGISQLINAQSVANLPFPGRDYRDLAQLTPSAQVVPGLRGGIRLGGQQSDYSGLVIDGGDATNNFFGEFFGSLETKNFTIPLDAVQEFQVITNGFAPEFGRSTGGLLNVVTKSGTNTIHGDFHYFLRSNQFTANDALGNPSNITKQHQFGGSVGFPIRRDRQFLFLAFDVQREHGPLATVFCPPGASQAACETSIQAAAGPAIAAPQPGEALPASCTSTTGAAMPTCYAVANVAGFEGINNQFQNLASVLGHYDWQITPANHFSIRAFYTRNHTDGFTGGRGQNEIAAAFNNTENFHNEGVNGILGLTSVFGRKVNEIRVMVDGETRPRHPNGNQPEVNILGVADFGQRFFLPINNDNGKLQGQDNFSYSFGKHDMKWGGDVDAFTDRKDIFAGWSQGEYLFATLQDFENNNPFGFIQGFGLNGKNIFQADILFPNYQTGLGLYWQDKWQATTRLSVTYGVRWDGTWNPQPQSLTPGSEVFAGQGSGSHLIAPPQRVPNDFGQWGPRIGMAYELGGSANPTIIRAAWGMYYAQTPTIFLPTIGSSKGATLFCFTPNSSGSGLSCAPPGGFPYLFPSSLPPNFQASDPALASAIGPPGISYVDPSFRNPKVSNLTVGVEHQLARGWSLSANYAYVHSWDLRTGGFSTTQWSRNVVSLGTDQFGRAILEAANGQVVNGSQCPFFGPQPIDCSIGEANALGSFGRANYNEFVAAMNKRFSSHFQFFANYTWSRNFDNASSERDTDSFFGPQDPFNVNLDYGRSGLDITHQFKTAGVVDLPWGFTLSSLAIAHSGLAYPAYILTDINGDGISNQGIGTNDRPTVQIGGGKPFLMPRYPARQPAFFNVDFRANKDIRLTERYHLQLLADLFNLFNRGNLSSNPDNSAFVNVPGCVANPLPAAGFTCPPLTALPKPGDPTPVGPTFRTLDQITAGATPFAFQMGLQLKF